MKSLREAALRIENFATTGGYADVIHDGTYGTLILVLVDPEYRGQGKGNVLLKQVHGWADRNHVGLWLVAHQLAPTGLDDRQLETWYGRLGWTALPLDVILMVRPADTSTPEGFADAIERHANYDYTEIPR